MKDKSYGICFSVNIARSVISARLHSLVMRWGENQQQLCDKEEKLAYKELRKEDGALGLLQSYVLLFDP